MIFERGKDDVSKFGTHNEMNLECAVKEVRTDETVAGRREDDVYRF